MSHHVNVCEYGYVHGQCRCASRDKTVVRIECPLGTEVHPDGIRYEPQPAAAIVQTPATPPIVRTRYRVKVWVDGPDGQEIRVFEGQVGDDDVFTLMQSEGASAKVHLTAHAAVELVPARRSVTEPTVCAEPGCDEVIIWVPRSGFGRSGDWQHRRGAPPDGRTRSHFARPKVYVT